MHSGLHKNCSNINHMTPALQTIHEIYLSLEQGNIGKLLPLLDNSVEIQTAQCLGGTKMGRDGILQLVSSFYRPGSGISKMVGQIAELDNRVIVIGNVFIDQPKTSIEPMPFADVWTFVENRISSAIFYYRDPAELCTHLSTRMN